MTNCEEGLDVQIDNSNIERKLGMNARKEYPTSSAMTIFGTLTTPKQRKVLLQSFRVPDIAPPSH